MSKYIDSEKLVAEIERLQQGVRNKWKENPRSSIDDGFLTACSQFLAIVASLQQEQPGCVEKTARISPGLISNFGTSTYVLDVDFTQDEMAKIAPFGFNSGKIKIKIVCE